MTWNRKNLEGVETLAPSASVYLTPERLEVQRVAREFAMTEVLPVADELDPQRGEIPDELLGRLAELGYFGVMIDSEHGGLGLGVFEYTLICEELARAWMSVASIIARGNGTGCAGRPDLLTRSARGEWIGGIAFSEPSAGSDLANVGCTAERVRASGATGGDTDEWVITGTKRWVGHALRADFLHLLARTREPREGHGRSDGLELFLVEKERGTFPEGVSGTPIGKIGYYGLTTWELQIDGLRLPADALQDTGQDEGQGFQESLRWLGPARVQTAARAVGLARGAVEDAIAYCHQRVQFGHPIADHQVIRHAIADMSADVEAARQLYMHAAWLVDSDDADKRTVDVATSQAKLFASETAERVTSRALQIFGGNGYTTEYSAERYWRDARLTTIFEGTSEIQRKIVSDVLVGH